MTVWERGLSAIFWKRDGNFFLEGGEKVKFFSKEHVGITRSFNIYLLN